jgi:hypothetical protein
MHAQWSCILHCNALPHLVQQAAKQTYISVLELRKPQLNTKLHQSETSRAVFYISLPKAKKLLVGHIIPVRYNSSTPHQGKHSEEWVLQCHTGGKQGKYKYTHRTPQILWKHAVNNTFHITSSLKLLILRNSVTPSNFSLAKRHKTLT